MEMPPAVMVTLSPRALKLSVSPGIDPLGGALPWMVVVAPASVLCTLNTSPDVFDPDTVIPPPKVPPVAE